MGKIASQFIFIWIAVFFVNNHFFPSRPAQEDVVERADLLLDMMEYESAIVNYLKVLSQDPQQRDVRRKLGYAYYQLEKVDEALNYIKEELTLFSDNSDAYDLLTYILYKSNKLNEANNFLESLDFPVRLTEENPHIGGLACFILGMNFKENKRFDIAKTCFRKAIEKEHDKVKCYVQLIDVDLVQGKLDPAITLVGYSPRRILAEAYEACGPQPEFYFIQGLRYFELAKSNVLFFRSFIRLFERAAELKPNLKDALYNLACISYNFNDVSKASEYFRKILEIEPENDEVKFYLDCCQKKLDTSLDKKLISEQCPKWINLSR